MVKTPKTRHSKTHREPVTIELEPGAVSRVTEAEATSEASAAADSATSEASAQASTAFGDETSSSMKGSQASHDYSFDDEQPARPEQPESEAPQAAARPSSAAYGGATMTAEPRRGSASTLAAGLVGGLIAALGFAGLQYGGVLGAPASGVEQVQTELVSLKSQLADLSAATNGGGALKGEVDGLSAALQQVKSEIETLKSAAGQVGSSEALAGLDGRIKQIETAVTALSQNSGAATEIATLNERVAGLDAAVKSAGDAATADNGKIATLEQSISTLTSKVEEIGRAHV